jgi:hypothetical protein
MIFGNLYSYISQFLIFLSTPSKKYAWMLCG